MSCRNLGMEDDCGDASSISRSSDLSGSESILLLVLSYPFFSFSFFESSIMKQTSCVVGQLRPANSKTPPIWPPRNFFRILAFGIDLFT